MPYDDRQITSRQLYVLVMKWRLFGLSAVMIQEITGRKSVFMCESPEMQKQSLNRIQKVVKF